MLDRLAATAGALSLSAFAFAAPMAEAKSQSIFAFQCLKAGKNYVVGLGPMPRPAEGVAINPSTIAPLAGSGSYPVALVNAPQGGVSVKKRCSSIATRLTNLALATKTATPAGIVALSDYFVAGKIAKQPVIAIGQLSLGDVLGTLPSNVNPNAALNVINARIRAISVGNAVAEALKNNDLVVFEAVVVD